MSNHYGILTHEPSDLCGSWTVTVAFEHEHAGAREGSGHRTAPKNPPHQENFRIMPVGVDGEGQVTFALEGLKDGDWVDEGQTIPLQIIQSDLYSFQGEATNHQGNVTEVFKLGSADGGQTLVYTTEKVNEATDTSHTGSGRAGRP